MVNPDGTNQENPDLKDLKRQRGGIKRQLTNLEQTLNEINSETDLDTLDLESRLKKHLDSWDYFNDIQTKIESLSAPTDERNNESERTSFEARYYKASGLLKKHSKVLEKQEREFIQALNSQGSSVTVNMNPENATNSQFNNFQLPKLQAPEFRGTFDTWLSFHDAFKSMCHYNPTMPQIQKFMYLKACLKDEAAEVIASLETTSENYSVAWELLKARFDNRKYIVDTHVKALFNLPLVSKENSIRSLLDNVQKHIRALKALNQPVDQWDTLLIFLIREKLNNYLREKWEESVGTSNVPSFKEMISFLERRALLEDTQSCHKQNNPLKSHVFKKKPQNSEANKTSKTPSCMTTTVTAQQTKWQPKCVICSEKHFLNVCNKFLSLSPQERYEQLKKTKLCHNCFYDNHKTSECRKAGCPKCFKKHNSLLHFDKQPAESSTSNSEELTVGLSELGNYCVNSHQVPACVILSTAIIKIADNRGHFHTGRALLDSGSQCNSITKKFADTLGLPKKNIDIKLKGVENLETKVQFSTATKIKSRTSTTELDASFLIFEEISSKMPSLPLNKDTFQIPKGIVLADPNFHEPAEIDILIGAEYFYDLLGTGQIRMKGQSAILQESTLGWIIAGKYTEPRSCRKKQISCNFMKFKEIPLLWELGQEKSSKFSSEEEKECENHYVENTTRNDTGDYTVVLPFNENKMLLGHSFNNALQRFQSLERKLEKNSELKLEYDQCIQGYLDEGHMSLIENDNPHSKQGYYLPHHAVVKSDSLTTKTRVVFDGSAKTTSGISLNDSLMVGPTIQEDLFSIILRFRTHRYALTADIQQMYRQVKVDSNSRLFQKILWRFSRNEPIKIYSLNTVTFGTASAPFLAIRTLHQLAEDEKDSYPTAAQIVKQDFYVDDGLTGSKTLNGAVELKNDLIELLKKGGFNLRKWASNHEKLRTAISNENTDSYLSLDPTKTIKTLGLQWNSITDSFSYTINLSNTNGVVTKRKIVSESATVYDPLGFLGPVVVTAKLIIQQLWKSNLDWDDPVPPAVESTWNLYKENLKSINDHNITRCIVIPEFVDVQLHGFCDASERAYGACLYILSTDKDGKRLSSLLCSKSRVAPLKTTTLPRLELCAANLLVKLYNVANSALHLNFKQVFFWSDSTIVINWINTPPNILKCFVANRISEIQASTQPSQWRHVPTQDNPADSLSRGQSSQDFIQNNLWHSGPTWLTKDPSNWPNLEIKTKDVPEKRSPQPILSFKITQENVNLLEKYSSSTKLIRVVAYCLRFYNNIKKKNKNNRMTGSLSTSEQAQSLNVIIKLIQSESFPKEVRALSRNENVDTKSKLLNLNPFFDEGIIKVGGRLKNANIHESQKHPIILPKGHQVTDLLIREEHLKRFHAGVQSTLYALRENYWILDGRNAVRHIIRQCVTCCRAKPQEFNYLMGNLPKNRLSFIRPFLNTGIDYCGPFFVKEHRYRNRTKVKTYVAVFVCLSTKAIHLELASDLTAEAFLSCLKRFIARRGMIKSLSSDNATNFTGANNELKKLYEQISILEKDNKTQNYLSKFKIDWNFIPPRAPHFGGLWEAAVKSFKFHFTRVTGTTLLTYEQLQTYVVQIEAILNSRPLTPLSSDPNDFLPLTPGHFLIGTALTTLPQADLREIPQNRLSNWQLAQQRTHHFWTRWRKEYLNELISRTKWQKTTDQGNIKQGTLVVIKEDNLPPMNWKLGRIVETHAGEDGVIRTLTIKSGSGICKRALKYVYPLPIDN